MNLNPKMRKRKWKVKAAQKEYAIGEVFSDSRGNTFKVFEAEDDTLEFCKKCVFDVEVDGCLKYACGSAFREDGKRAFFVKHEPVDDDSRFFVIDLTHHRYFGIIDGKELKNVVAEKYISSLQQSNLKVGEEAKLRGFMFKRLPPETIESLKKEIARLEQIIKSQDETLKDAVTTLLHRFGISEQSLVSESLAQKRNSFSGKRICLLLAVYRYRGTFCRNGLAMTANCIEKSCHWISTKRRPFRVLRISKLPVPNNVNPGQHLRILRVSKGIEEVWL